MNENPLSTAATAVGVAGGAALLAPIAAPTLHGIAGFAVIGLGVYATGSAVFNATSFVSKQTSGFFSEGSAVAALLKGSVFAGSKQKAPPKEIPFARGK